MTLILSAMILLEMPLFRGEKGADSGTRLACANEVASRERRLVGLQGLIGASQAIAFGVAGLALGTDFAPV